MRVLTETALARRIVAGDNRAFAELFRRHRQDLYGFCISIVGDEEDAADALQNTMAKALHSLPGENRELRLKPWLFRVAHNQCIDILRARRGNEDIEDHQLPSPIGLEASVATRERLRQLLADLDQLPERQRGALLMRELNGLGFQEIGDAFDTTPSAAKQLVYEARCALQEQGEGREMGCDAVRKAISAGDGRVLAGRKIRAHLKSCESCADFRSGIEARRDDLRALVPPIPVALVLSIGGMFGGGGGGGGLASLLGIGGGSQAALSGGAMKTIAVVAVSAGVGAGTIGVVEGRRDSRDSAAPEVGNTAESSSMPGPAASPLIPANVAAGADRGGIGPTASERGNKRAAPDRTRPGIDRGPRRQDQVVPGVPDKPESVPPGSSTPPAEGPGRSEEAPGHSGDVPGAGKPESTGPPADLPAASDHGQSQAEAHANPKSAVAVPPATGRPADPGASGNGQSKSKKYSLTFSSTVRLCIEAQMSRVNPEPRRTR